MLPTKDELTEIDRALTEAGALPAARAAAIEAFNKGEFTPERVDSWFALQSINRPELFPAKIDHAAARAAEHADLMREAFEGKGPARVTSRGALVKAIGEEAADKAAKDFGLRNLHDYNTSGVRPVTDDDATNKPKRPGSDNPWSAAGWSITRQGQVHKAVGAEKAQQMARAAGSHIGATKPPKA